MNGINRWRFETDSRYYEVEITTDLFGQFVLMRYWGGKGSSRFGKKDILIKNQQEGRLALETIKKQRLKRGYIELKEQ